MSQTDKIKTLQRQIAEGLQPVCPICGSGLKIDKQEGATGAYSYNYSCTKENDPNCSLRPATVYTSWSRRIEHALKSKVVAVAVAVIGSISLTLGAGTSLGWIQFGAKTGGEGGADTEVPATDHSRGETSAALLDSLRGENRQLQASLDAARKELDAAGRNEAQVRLLALGRLWRALRPASKEPPVPVRHLWEALAALDSLPDLPVSAQDKNELTEQLASKIVLGELRDADDIERAIRYTQKFGLNIRKNQNLGIAYFHLGDKRDFWKNRFVSMAFFLDYLQEIRNRNRDQLPAEKNTILPSIRNIFNFARDSQKLPPGWQNLTLPELEALIDEDPAGILPARTAQLRNHAAGL